MSELTETRTPSRSGGNIQIPILFGLVIAVAAATAYLFFSVDGLKTDLHSMRESVLAELAKGASLREAATKAKAYVTAAIAAADELHIGKGRGPVHHFHAFWPKSGKPQR